MNGGGAHMNSTARMDDEEDDGGEGARQRLGFTRVAWLGVPFPRVLGASNSPGRRARLGLRDRGSGGAQSQAATAAQ